MNTLHSPEQTSGVNVIPPSGDSSVSNPQIIYPTTPDQDGFFIESADDAEMEISTKVYDNGNKVKKCFLPACCKTAVVRELIAKDSKEIARFSAGNSEQYQLACVTVATTFDGEKLPFEAIEVLKYRDYTRLITMWQSINFS